jgi:hypothetical protein
VPTMEGPTEPELDDRGRARDDFLPTIQPTVSGVLHDVRVFWPFPRSYTGDLDTRVSD